MARASSRLISGCLSGSHNERRDLFVWTTNNDIIRARRALYSAPQARSPTKSLHVRVFTHRLFVECHLRFKKGDHMKGVCRYSGRCINTGGLQGHRRSRTRGNVETRTGDGVWVFLADMLFKTLLN